MTEETPRLLTIGPSHYCEKARWALDLAGVAYHEEPYVPMFHWGPVRRAGGGRTVPCLLAQGDVLADSPLVLDYASQHGSFSDQSVSLRPGASELREEVRAWETRFDSDLGPAVRRIAYFHLLPHRKLVLDAMDGPWVQRTWLALAFPVWRAMLRRGLKIDAAGAARSQEKLETVLAEVDSHLASGRGYLVDDRFTGADLTLAALLAPLALPPEHPVLGASRKGDLPQSFEAFRAPLQGRPSLRHTLRMYKQHRNATVDPVQR